MARFAVIEEGVVTNVAEADEAFAAEVGWVAAEDGVEAGWTWDGESFTAPVVPIGELLDRRLAELADLRWRKETGGIVVGGMPIKTDRESQGLLTGAYIMASANPAFSINWKVANGVFVPIDAATIVMAGDAVTGHVQACFDREEELTTLLISAFAADDAAALAAIDITAGWPG